MERLTAHVRENERWLMERILSYAEAQGYTRYTSTLVEAWRVSIQGLSEALARAVEMYGDSPIEFTPEESFADDPVAQFGVIEARRHRERGVSLSMFLGLFKYYRYVFMELAEKMDAPPESARRYAVFVERFFDHVEIAFCTQWSGLSHDAAVAELQRSNRLMTNEKNKYLTLFESLDVPVLLVDEHGRLDNANAPGARLLGLRDTEGGFYYGPDAQAPAGAHNKPLAEILDWLKAPLTRLLEGKEASFRLELEALYAGKPRCYAALFSRMRDVSGKFRGGVVALDDVTERKKMERLKADVDKLTRHDLKAPLSSMLSVFNLLLEHETLPDEDRRRFLTMARESGYDMLGIISRSLDIFKMEMGTYAFEPESVDLGLILRRVARRLARLAERRGVTLSVRIDGVALNAAPAGPFVQAEDSLLSSALSNLIANALEASPKGGEASVDVEANAFCRIVIANQGGVPEQIRHRFFEKYATFGKKKGTGLGAYGARLFIETMNGEISMASDDDRTAIAISLLPAEE